jgi:hypothetical protein
MTNKEIKSLIDNVEINSFKSLCYFINQKFGDIFCLVNIDENYSINVYDDEEIQYVYLYKNNGISDIGYIRRSKIKKMDKQCRCCSYSNDWIDEIKINIIDNPTKHININIKNIKSLFNFFNINQDSLSFLSFCQKIINEKLPINIILNNEPFLKNPGYYDIYVYSNGTISNTKIDIDTLKNDIKITDFIIN